MTNKLKRLKLIHVDELLLFVINIQLYICIFLLKNIGYTRIIVMNENALAFMITLLKRAIFGFSSKSSHNSENKCREEKLLFTSSLLHPSFMKNALPLWK